MTWPEPDRPADAGLPDAAMMLDLPVPAECLPGVRVALAALSSHWRNVADFTVPHREPR